MRSMDVLAADWTTICRRIVAAQRPIFERAKTSEERTHYEGVGEGGDRTLVIDRECEDVVFAELEQLADEGASFVAVSEERGEVAFGAGGEHRIVIDPIDGSMNARRTIPSFAVSIAVSSGPSMADVQFGFVHDFGADEGFMARRGEGATLDGIRAGVTAAAERLEGVGRGAGGAGRDPWGRHRRGRAAGGGRYRVGRAGVGAAGPGGAGGQGLPVTGGRGD